MGTLLIDKDQLLAHSTDDGNTLTEISGTTMQKTEISDDFGTSLLWDKSKFTRDTLGTITEGTPSSGKLRTYTIPAAGQTEAAFCTLNGVDFNDGVYEMWIDTFNSSGGTNWRGTYVMLYVDAAHHCYIGRYLYPSGSENIINALCWYDTGLYDYQTFSTAAVANIGLRITKSGNDWLFEYKIASGSWTTLLSTTRAVGSDFTLYFGNQGAYQGALTADLDYMHMSGTGVYWATKTDSSAIKDTFNEQDVGAGSIIQFGSATITEGSNMLYDYKLGSDAWVTGRTSAQVVALGNQVTDDGKFDWRAVYNGSNAQASWTSFSTSTVSAGGNRKFIRGVNANLGRNLIGV